MRVWSGKTYEKIQRMNYVLGDTWSKLGGGRGWVFQAEAKVQEEK